MIDMRVNTEKTAKNILHAGLEVFGEGNVQLRRKEDFVIQLFLHPIHKKVRVHGAETLTGFLYLSESLHRNSYLHTSDMYGRNCLLWPSSHRWA